MCREIGIRRDVLKLISRKGRGGFILDCVGWYAYEVLCLSTDGMGGGEWMVMQSGNYPASSYDG